MIKHTCANSTCHKVFYTYSRKDLFCSSSCRDSELSQDLTELQRIEDKYLIGKDNLPTSTPKAKWLLTSTPEKRRATRPQKPIICHNCQKVFYTYYAQTIYCSPWCKEHYKTKLQRLLTTNQDIAETTKIAHSNLKPQKTPEASVSLDFKVMTSLGTNTGATLRQKGETQCLTPKTSPCTTYSALGTP